ncbi:MAG: hypothetical protein HY326_08430 [Chloroflexi bacterium]|nr:hypothetical protein [Chloroflexota bacterium]
MAQPAEKIKIKIVEALDELPPESLETVAEFVEFLRSKRAHHTPVRLGGLWAGYTFSEEEIRAARREIWQSHRQDLDD